MVDSYAKARPHLSMAELTSDICNTKNEEVVKSKGLASVISFSHISLHIRSVMVNLHIQHRRNHRHNLRG